MKIFLTGSSGMVGRNIINLNSSLEHPHDLICPSRAEVDLNSYDAVRSAMDGEKPDLVIHCAGLVGGIQANIAAPFDFLFQNMQVGSNVIKAAYDSGITKLVNLGSSCMYPRQTANPIPESALLTSPLEPTNEGYAIAKIAVAKLTETISSQYGVQYKTYIPCNLYGYWDSFGEHNSHMIPAVIKKIHEAVQSNAPDVVIWGDGQARREFMFAEDLADFILFSLNCFDSVPQMLNVGLGHDYSIQEYYETIAEALDYHGAFTYDLSKPAGMKQKLVNIDRQTELGWKPKTDLLSGVKKSYQFYLNETH